MIALAKMGIQVVGFDASEDLAAACKENLFKAGVMGEISWVKPGKTYESVMLHDGLVIGRGVYHHIPSRKRRIEFLNSCRKQIKEGAPMFLGDVLIRTSKGRFAASALPSAIEHGDSVSDCFYHYFTRTELLLELAQGGYDVEDYRSTPVLGANSLAHVICRKKHHKK